MLDRRVSGVALLLLPAGLMAYFAFNAGGFYPGPPAFVAVFLSVVLMLRVLGSTAPFEGAGRAVGVAAAALGLFALLTLLSETWSHAPGLSLVAFDHVLVYLLVMALFGLLAHTRQRLTWIVRAIAAAIVVICTCSLITRILPRVWPTAPNIANDRLSFPLTYWNALGLLAVFGILLCVHFTSDEREPLVARIGGAAALPVLATTLYFTFSRGSIAVCLITVVLYGLIARPRGLLSTALSALPATVIALTVAYGANVLATPHPTTAEAIRQGHGVAIAVFACAIGAGAVRALLAVLVDRRVRRIEVSPSMQRRIAWGVWGGTGLALAIAGVVLAGTISREYHQFLKPASPGNASDLRTRLTDPGNNGRIEMWRIAWHQFKAKPLLGQGAGTYKNAFLEHRVTNDFVVNAHSLYLETLDELGVVGLVLLLVAIIAMFVAAAIRIRGPGRALYASVFVLILAWALETGIDWDWQMPAVTIVPFALGGYMLARPLRPPVRGIDDDPTGSPRALATHMRTALGVGCLLLAVAPAYVWLSERKLGQATAAFADGDCRTATDAALSSISILPVRAEAYEVVAYCDIRRDLPRLAIQAMSKAVSLDRNDWNYSYGLALARGAAGLNPLSAARRALRLNPREPLAEAEWQTFRDDAPSQWAADAKTIADGFNSL